jgi:hypothetical protein
LVAQFPRGAVYPDYRAGAEVGDDRTTKSVLIHRQCELLRLSRAALYYRPVEVGGYELELMALIDRQYLRTPFYGSRVAFDFYNRDPYYAPGYVIDKLRFCC